MDSCSGGRGPGKRQVDGKGGSTPTPTSPMPEALDQRHKEPACPPLNGQRDALTHQLGRPVAAAPGGLRQTNSRLVQLICLVKAAHPGVWVNAIGEKVCNMEMRVPRRPLQSAAAQVPVTAQRPPAAPMPQAAAVHTAPSQPSEEDSPETRRARPQSVRTTADRGTAAPTVAVSGRSKGLTGTSPESVRSGRHGGSPGQSPGGLV